MTVSGRFVEVLLPLPLYQKFTYSVPEELSGRVQVGCRVIVPLGSRKLYTGIVLEIHDRSPEKIQVKPVLYLLEDSPILREPQLKFWEWLSSYNICALGDVMNAALPSGLKLESETSVMLADDFESEVPLKQRENQVLDALVSGKETNLQVLSKCTGIVNILPVVQTLMEKGALVVSEGLRHTYKVKTKSFIRLCEPYRSNSSQLNIITEELYRAKKQSGVLMMYLQLSGYFEEKKSLLVSKKELLDQSGASPAVLQTLLARGVLEVFQQAVDRRVPVEEKESAASVLSPRQVYALKAIQASFQAQPVCLLHGLTSSGKTEIYIHLIEECLKSGKQALYLVPEIALTTQLADRLKRVFGAKLGVYHSKFPDAERVEVWKKMLQPDGYPVVLGVRSSIFLPFQHLGLIIVDEEHEGSYKQQEPAPRYHARNAALMLASLHGAKTLLGTATPSLETYRNAQAGKYGLVELFARHFDMEMPEIVAVNTKELKRKKIMKSLFSPFLLIKIEEALSVGDQVILFQNRRGYAPILECPVCGYIPKCERCDVSLTLHKYHNKLTCHYCGFEREIPQKCPSCGAEGLITHGFGTEQIEEEVRSLFPTVRVARMDTDTTRTRRSYEQIIHAFEEKKIDILIGTQMVSKGLDFERVHVVGILNADQMLNFPDFRAHERSFQLMSQVSGRAGRQGKRGLVIVQTSDPEHPVIKDVIENDFGAFFRREMVLREAFSYPPFTRLIQIRFKHRDAVIVRRAAMHYAACVKPYFKDRLLGPDQPSVARINNFYYQQLLLKTEIQASSAKVREVLLWAQDELKQNLAFRPVQVSFDVDPL
jgi:primosomal protein N' (replication factor Y) (superfamily II helicase)